MAENNSAAGAVKLETNGVNPVPDNERYGTPQSVLFPVWFSWNSSIVCVTYGIYIYACGLSFMQAIICGIIGYILSCAMVGVLSVGGARTGLPSLTQTRYVFGVNGNRIPALFAYISNLGWKVTTITLAATSGADMCAKLAPSVCANPDGTYTTGCLAVWFVMTMVLSMSAAIYGHQLIVKVEKYIALIAGVMTVIFFFIVAPQIDVASLGRQESGGFFACVGGVVMAMTMVGLGFLNYGGDFGRYLPRRTPASGIIFWTTAGLSIPVIVMLVFGVLLADSNPSLSAAAAMQPIGALTALLPFWFYVPFSIVIVLSLMSGAMTGVYSSGLALMSVGIPASRAVTTALNAVIIALGGFYLLFISTSFLATFQAFLAAISVLTGTMGAIEMIDFIRQRRLKWDTRLAMPLGQGGLNVRRGAIACLIIASVIGLGTITSADPYIAHIVGFLLPDSLANSVFASANVGVIIAMAVGGLLYYVLTFGLHYYELPPEFKDAKL